MNLFRVINAKTGDQSLIQAFDMNAARRKTKKALGFVNTKLPKSIWVLPVTPQEMEAMMQAQMAAQQVTEVPQADVPLVDPLNNFQTIEAAADVVEGLQVRADEIRAEVAEVTAELQG